MLEAFVTELSRALRRRAKKVLGLPARTRAHTGAVSVAQRGDSALRLNVHFHALVLDGVYVSGAAGKLGFHALAPPTTDEVTEVAVRTAKRLQKVLARHGRLLDDGTVDPSPKGEQLALSALVGAVASDRVEARASSGTRVGVPSRSAPSAISTLRNDSSCATEHPWPRLLPQTSGSGSAHIAARTELMFSRCSAGSTTETEFRIPYAPTRPSPCGSSSGTPATCSSTPS